MEPELPPEPTPEPDPELPAAAVPSEPPPSSSGLEAVPVLVPAAYAAPPPPAFRDRSTGLVVFGILQIILGLLAGLMIPFVFLSAFMARKAGGDVAMRPGQYVSTIAVYALVAAAQLTLGIGSVQKRRWARALTLVSSWYWLIMGILITILLTAVLPVMMRSVMNAQHNTGGAPPEALSTGVMAVIVTLIIIFFAFFLVVVPIAFVVFYSGKNVDLTCRYHDPLERWTDRAPLPVLGASLPMSVGAIYLLILAFTTPLLPFFGRYLTGLAGGAGMLLLAALDAYLAVALFRLKSSAWWIAVVTIAIRLVSLVLTYGRGNLMEAYSKMGWSATQLQTMNANPMFRSHVILWWSLLSMVGYFGYLLWLKRYFKASNFVG